MHAATCIITEIKTWSKLFVFCYKFTYTYCKRIDTK